MKGALIGKVYSCFFDHQVSVVTFLVQPYGVFVSNGTQGGGQVHKHCRNVIFAFARALRLWPQRH
jgi:hypothetical protein